MSEYIDNRSNMKSNKEQRQKVLKEIILQLHDGKDPAEVKEEFAKLIEGVSASEISEMESGLVAEGMAVEEIQKLCDVHAEIFRGAVTQIHTTSKEEEKPGHPVRVLREENFAIENLLKNTLMPKVAALTEETLAERRYELLEDVNLLLDIDKHYSRKENILFPYMEKYGITAPPKVMWGVDDEIRVMIKGFKALLNSPDGTVEDLKAAAEAMNTKILDMIFKEESILIPMLLETLTEDEWVEIALDSDEIGYCIVSPEAKWSPSRMIPFGAPGEGNAAEAVSNAADGLIRMETGILKVDELTRILNTLPIDMTFIDKDDNVKYFSQSAERIFPRTKSVIGRSVQNCHPPSSVHVVETILEAFKAGRKDHEHFWIQMGDAMIYIRYFAVRGEQGEYLGTLEVTQNIAPLKAIEGQKRLLSENF
ncbi:DUF438 domain-containing protein [Acidaminobacter hydrogenoformans]|uniref:PAC domain-containing protein n=1 Tax=Acidaminobacter hydrogenoformans DSM 2784 TaxID=1120920 RepID=A0A1G5RTA6_9FIRM|nr:DUF438 domain-containing protein [Acidaminobacter hydrogenoformans]SCZ76539.1 hypothetical protein SAMN03080599_00291 [Acidaminobacter hydrogenoformans DSM 2784]